MVNNASTSNANDKRDLICLIFSLAMANDEAIAQ